MRSGSHRVIPRQKPSHNLVLLRLGHLGKERQSKRSRTERVGVRELLGHMAVAGIAGQEGKRPRIVYAGPDALPGKMPMDEGVKSELPEESIR